MSLFPPPISFPNPPSTIGMFFSLKKGSISGGGYTPAQQIPTFPADGWFTIFQTNINPVGGSFLTSNGYNLRRVTVSLEAVLNPTMDIQCQIQSDSGGAGSVPSGVLGTSTTTINASTLSTVGFINCNFDFSPAVSLSATTRYWVVLVGSSTDVSNYVLWAGTTTNPANENFAQFTSGVWGNTSTGNCWLTITTYS